MVDDFVVVDTDAVCAGIKDVFEDTRSILEPAGAMGVAGIKRYVEANNLKDQVLVAITCGANMNFDRLRFVAERAEVGEEREALFAVTLPEKRGSFKRLCEILGDRNLPRRHGLVQGTGLDPDPWAATGIPEEALEFFRVSDEADADHGNATVQILARHTPSDRRLDVLDVLGDTMRSLRQMMDGLAELAERISKEDTAS